MYREPNDRDSLGIGLLARNAGPPKSRQSHQPSGVGGESATPAQAPSKASDLISHMNRNLALPRIQSSRSSQLSQPSILARQISRQKMMDIQKQGMKEDFSTAASQQSKRSRIHPLNEQKSNIGGVSSHQESPVQKSERKYGIGSRPTSIQRSQIDDLSSLNAPSYNGGTRADQSALDHIRRIRRNVPS